MVESPKVDDHLSIIDCPPHAAVAEWPGVIEIQTILQTGDSYAAVEHIQRDGTPLKIAARYQSLVLDLYWKAHDLPAVITIGRAGILHCLSQSLAADIPPDSKDNLRSTAKAIAFNLGSFTWPGWEEPGIAPAPSDLAIGRDCALLNLRLALELKKPPKALSNAHWLIGVHALASGDFELAEKEFELALEVLPAGDESTNALETLNLGFLAVAQICSNPSNPDTVSRLAKILASLRQQNNDDAKTYASQLEASLKLFGPKTQS